MIRYYLIGILAVLAWNFLWMSLAYVRGWKHGYKAGHSEGLRDGFKEGQGSKEKDWWAQAGREVEEEKARLWRESGAA